MPDRLCLLYGPGCSDGARCRPGQSRCGAHGGRGWARVDPEARRRYDDPLWKSLRAAQLREEPMCARCGEMASTVNHITAVADGGGFLDRANLESLCRSCHKEAIAEQNRARKRKR